MRVNTRRGESACHGIAAFYGGFSVALDGRSSESGCLGFCDGIIPVQAVPALLDGNIQRGFVFAMFQVKFRDAALKVHGGCTGAERNAVDSVIIKVDGKVKCGVLVTGQIADYFLANREGLRFDPVDFFLVVVICYPPAAEAVPVVDEQMQVAVSRTASENIPHAAVIFIKVILIRHIHADECVRPEAAGVDYLVTGIIQFDVALCAALGVVVDHGVPGEVQFGSRAADGDTAARNARAVARDSAAGHGKCAVVHTHAAAVAGSGTFLNSATGELERLPAVHINAAAVFRFTVPDCAAVYLERSFLDKDASAVALGDTVREGASDYSCLMSASERAAGLFGGTLFKCAFAYGQGARKVSGDRLLIIQVRVKTAAVSCFSLTVGESTFPYCNFVAVDFQSAACIRVAIDKCAVVNVCLGVLEVCERYALPGDTFTSPVDSVEHRAALVDCRAFMEIAVHKRKLLRGSPNRAAAHAVFLTR